MKHEKVRRQKAEHAAHVGSPLAYAWFRLVQGAPDAAFYTHDFVSLAGNSSSKGSIFFFKGEVRHLLGIAEQLATKNHCPVIIDDHPWAVHSVEQAEQLDVQENGGLVIRIAESGFRVVSDKHCCACRLD